MLSMKRPGSTLIVAAMLVLGLLGVGPIAAAAPTSPAGAVPGATRCCCSRLTVCGRTSWSVASEQGGVPGFADLLAPRRPRREAAAC